LTNELKSAFHVGHQRKIAQQEGGCLRHGFGRSRPQAPLTNSRKPLDVLSTQCVGADRAPRVGTEAAARGEAIALIKFFEGNDGEASGP
jgi:hypothetical protein